MKQVVLFCDGACKGNPGPGGWGAILRYGPHEIELSGGEAETTNNRMELAACIEGLKRLREPCAVTVVTDSQYVANAFTQGWLENWQRKGWRTTGRSPVKNRELWESLLALAKTHQLTWQWVRGHAGHPENERCDRLAVAASERARTTGIAPIVVSVRKATEAAATCETPPDGDAGRDTRRAGSDDGADQPGTQRPVRATRRISRPTRRPRARASTGIDATEG